MILTAAAIQSARSQGELVIEPFDAAALNPNTYNLRLDSTVLRSDGPSWEPLEVPAEGLVLDGQVLYLGSTVERFGGSRLVPIISARSSVARLGLFVHLVADMGNTGAVHGWTLELFPTLAIRVYPQMPIVQVAFWRTVGDIDSYSGSYQLHDNATTSYATDTDL